MPTSPSSSELDPLRLVPAMCQHGVEQHPLWPDKPLRTGVTWIRGRYVDRAGRCVVCRGEPAPPDFPYDRTALPPVTQSANAHTVFCYIENRDKDRAECRTAGCHGGLEFMEQCLGADQEDTFQPMPPEVSDRLPYVEE